MGTPKGIFNFPSINIRIGDYVGQRQIRRRREENDGTFRRRRWQLGDSLLVVRFNVRWEASSVGCRRRRHETPPKHRKSRLVRRHHLSRFHPSSDDPGGTGATAKRSRFPTGVYAQYPSPSPSPSPRSKMINLFIHSPTRLGLGFGLGFHSLFLFVLLMDGRVLNVDSG